MSLSTEDRVEAHVAGIQKKKVRGAMSFDNAPACLRGYGVSDCAVWESKRPLASGNITEHAEEVLPSNWSVIVLALVAVITAVWIGVLAFGLIHLIQHVF
jgi:hypothetical protein